MNLNDTKSSQDLRKEITKDLDRLDTNIDALKEKMSPGQVIDDAIFRNFRGDPKGSLLYLKSNPVGTSFLALGTFLLMDNEGESYEQYLKKQSRVVYSDYRGKATDLVNQASQRTSEISSRVDHISRDMKDRARGMIDRGEEKLNSIKDRVSQKGRSAKGSISTSFEEMKDNVIDASETFKERALHARHELNDDVNPKFGEAVEGISSSGEGLRSKVGEYGKNISQKFRDNGFDSLAYVSLGLGAGFATGGLIPIGEESETFSDLDFDFSGFRSEIENAANESINLFKDEIIEGLKNRSVDIF